MLARLASKVVAVEVLDEAYKNTLLTLESEDKAVRERVIVFREDLSYLRDCVRQTGTKFQAAFFNCPIFKGGGNANSMAGEDFELPKRVLLLLPEILDEQDGVAYFLAAKPHSRPGEERLWTLDKLKEFFEQNMPSWIFRDLGYRTRYNCHGEYLVVEIISTKDKEPFLYRDPRISDELLTWYRKKGNLTKEQAKRILGY